MTLEPEPDLLMVLARRWLTVGLFVAVGLGAAIAYAVVAPNWFEARLTVVPSTKSQDPASSIMASLPSFGGLGPSMSTDVQRIAAVLGSNSVADEVITKFELMKLYDTVHPEHARDALWKHCSIAVDRKSSVVSLTCEDRDPERAKAMAGYFGEVGNRVFGRISASSAREERKFLENQVVKARKDVDEASQKLRMFQQQHKVVDLGEQSKAVISAMASIKGEMVSKQLELSYLSGFSSRTESNVVQLQQQIGIMESKLRQLEDSTRLTPAASGSGAGSDSDSAKQDNKFFPDAMKVPELRYELEQLFREQKIQETVFAMLIQRYEMAKVDEARDTSTFQILDTPTLPTHRSRPKRKKLAMMGAAGGFGAACAFVLLPLWWRRRSRAPGAGV